MFRYICKTLDLKLSYVRYLQTLQSLKSSQSSKSQHSLTVSYLMDSCGLSLENALSASKVINIKRTAKSDSVIKLLTDHGFSKTHIAKLVSKHPPLILANPEKILKPKIEFYKSLGILGPDLPKILCSNKLLLASSLKNQIIPTVEFLKGYVGSNEKVVNAFKQSTRVIGCDIQNVMLPNINALRVHGVPEVNVGKLIEMQPRALMLSNDLFEKVVNAVGKMGFDPKTRKFILAVRCMSVMSIVNWEKKKEVFFSFGWSEEDFATAFRVQPMIMLTSAEKIRGIMEFFENEMGLNSLSVVKCPNLFLTSLESRLIPRWFVLQIVMSKGLTRKNLDVIWEMNSTKAIFEKKFVTSFKEECPEIIKAYQGEMKFEQPANGVENISGLAVAE